MSDKYLEVLDSIDRRIAKITENAKLTRHGRSPGNMQTSYHYALQLEDAAERLVLLTRVLPAYTGNPRAVADVESIMEGTIPVELGFTEQGWFSLRIPALLPKKEKGSPSYIRGYLYPALAHFFRDKPLVRFRDCVLIYRHVYDRERPDRRWRDHDNIELNMVTDCVAMYVLPDDGPKVCSHYYCSTAGPEDRTEVYVVPKEDFPRWLELEPHFPEAGISLFESHRREGKKHM